MKIKQILFLISIGLLVSVVAYFAPEKYQEQDQNFGATILFPSGGGTGTSTNPSYGQMLVGNSGGTYTLTATSSLGIGGVSSISTNNGLTGGPITTTGTIGLNTTGFLTNGLLTWNGSNLVATGTPALSVGFIIATTTTTSTFTGGATFGINTGNVGVGTTSPYAKLSIVGETVSAFFTATTTSTSTLPNLLSTNATTTNFNISGQLSADLLTSALTLTGATGIFAEYTGTTCTNQVMTTLSALGVATCSSINNDYWSGTDLSVANGGTGLSTFGGTNTILYTTSADNLSSESALTYNASTDLLTTINASTTNLTVSSFFQLPNSASQSPTLAGACAIDTTSGQLKCGDGTNTLVIGNGKTYPAFTYATSTAWTGTTTIPIGTAYVAETWNGAQCFTDVGTLQVSFHDGTNRMDWINASTTVGTNTFTTNNTFVAAEKRYVDVGTPATSPTKISCTVNKSLTSD